MSIQPAKSDVEEMRINSIPEPPLAHVQGISNFRSIGGYPIKSSTAAAEAKRSRCSTRHNFIYRSADPCYITPAGRSQVTALGITTVYDLRSQPEVDKQMAKEPSSAAPIAEGVVRHFTPVFAHEDWSPEAIAERHLTYADSSDSQSGSKSATGYARAYSEMLERGGSAFREILLHVRDRPGEAFLIHCSAGKDRTGVAAAILLKIAGCADDVVATEYALTEVGLAARREFIIQYLMKQDALQGSREKAERVASAKYVLSFSRDPGFFWRFRFIKLKITH